MTYILEQLFVIRWRQTKIPSSIVYFTRSAHLSGIIWVVMNKQLNRIGNCQLLRTTQGTLGENEWSACLGSALVFPLPTGQRETKSRSIDNLKLIWTKKKSQIFWILALKSLSRTSALAFENFFKKEIWNSLNIAFQVFVFIIFLNTSTACTRKC